VQSRKDVARHVLYSANNNQSDILNDCQKAECTLLVSEELKEAIAKATFRDVISLSNK
jgi:hypothetical protein